MLLFNSPNCLLGVAVPVYCHAARDAQYTQSHEGAKCGEEKTTMKIKVDDTTGRQDGAKLQSDNTREAIQKVLVQAGVSDVCHGIELKEGADTME